MIRQISSSVGFLSYISHLPEALTAPTSGTYDPVDSLGTDRRSRLRGGGGGGGNPDDGFETTGRRDDTTPGHRSDGRSDGRRPRPDPPTPHHHGLYYYGDGSHTVQTKWCLGSPDRVSECVSLTSNLCLSRLVTC